MGARAGRAGGVRRVPVGWRLPLHVAGAAPEPLLNKLVELGCGYEGANRSYIAINIPPLVQLTDVTELLIGSRAQWEHADPTL